MGVRRRTKIPEGAGAQASQHVLRRPCGRRDSPTSVTGALAWRGVCVAGSCWRGAGMARHAGQVARAERSAGCRGTRKVWQGEAARRRALWWRRKVAAASSAGLGRRAERRAWRRAARPARRAGGVRRGSGPGWSERGRGEPNREVTASKGHAMPLILWSQFAANFPGSSDYKILGRLSRK